MAYNAAMLASSARDRVRFMITDTDPDNSFLQDAEYDFILQRNNDDEDMAAYEAAVTILGLLTGSVRQREGLIEVYGDQHFKQYLKFLENYVQTKTLRGNMDGLFKVGGVIKREVRNNRYDDDANPPPYHENFLFEQTDETFGGGSKAVGDDLNRRRGRNPLFVE